MSNTNPLHAAWYYDLTPDHCHSGDAESLLVWLCPICATRLVANGEVKFAGTDKHLYDVPCWQCEAEPLPAGAKK